MAPGSVERIQTHPILIVDDDADIREALSDYLELEGYRAYGAENGAQALKCLQASHLPCLILLDLTMPVMDGVQFRAKQLEDPAIAKIPVVVITAGGKTREVPADVPIIRKPLDLNELLSAVRRYCLAEA